MHRTAFLSILWLVAALLPLQGMAQSASLQVEPSSLELEVGETARLSAKVVDAEGTPRQDRVVFYSRSRRAVEVYSDGQVTAHQPGTYEVVALRPGQGEDRLVTTVPVTVAYPDVQSVSFGDVPRRVYRGTRIVLPVEVVDVQGTLREEAPVQVTSSQPEMASVDEGRRLHAHRAGEVTLTAESGGVRTERRIQVVANPVRRLELQGGKAEAQAGEVLDFAAAAYDAQSERVADAPVLYSLRADPEDDRGAGASGQIDQRGRFVAEKPGLYTVVATSGPHTAVTDVRVRPRTGKGEIEVVGHARVSNVHTSDLWVWEGGDGRDYAVTGTWGGNGEAYFWDVTDPASMTPIDTVRVDARTVNDVKVSEDGDVCIISREGASNRKNGIVILDCSDPHDVTVHATFDDGLTGGVHNVFIYEDHVYALSNTRRYDVINIEDPAYPHRVGQFELDTPGHSVHDVWVEDGIAYSSNWDDGVVLADVGGGDAGGSPANPVKIGSYAYPSGWNHAAFPYESEETGKFYVIVGDEAFPRGLHVTDRPTRPAGWIHFIDFTDRDNPEEVARYQVPEAGTHNFWVKDDLLYVAYYNGGLRVVDISGDLKGNLYEQGREVARFYPEDPQGFIPNAPMAWGPQPHKGMIFFSDWNSGLWAVKLVRNP